MSGYVTTPNLGLRKPEVGGSGDAWGNDLNVNADTLDAAVGSASANVGRNLIHNGLFNIAQRGNGLWTTSAAYTVDRWVTGASGTDVISYGRNPLSDGDRAQIGDEAAVWYLRNDFTGSAAGENYINQPIEGVRRIAGKTVVVSLWANGTAGLKLGVNIAHVFGTGGSPSPAVYAQPTGQVAILATGWARYSFVFNIPSVNGKTFGSDGNAHTLLRFWCSGGTTNPGSGNIGVQSGAINFWGVQLEIAAPGQTKPTPLEKPDPAVEWATCQRFYQVIPTGASGGAGAGVTYSSTIPTRVLMRAVPLLTNSTPVYMNASGFNASAGGSNSTITTWAVATAAGYTSYTATVYASADL